MSVVIKINSARENRGFFYRVVALSFVTIIIVMLGAWDSPKAEKQYPVSLTINQWISHSNGLDFIRQQVLLSDLSAKAKSVIIDSVLSPLQNDIGRQVQPLYQMEQKRLQDSVDKSKVKPKQ